MALKKPSAQMQSRRKDISEAEAEEIANRLADRPYGDSSVPTPAQAEASLLKRTSISIPAELLEKVEDTALKNKRQGNEPKSVSAIIRDALNQYFLKN